MSAESYVRAIFFQYALSGEFDAKFQDAWIEEEEFKNTFDQALFESFVRLGYQPTNEYIKACGLLEYIERYGGLITDGDSYTGMHAKFSIPEKDQIIKDYLQNSDEARRLEILGNQAWQNALRRAAEELGWAKLDSVQGNEVTRPSSVVEVPASDRMVNLNHNEPEYLAIKDGLEELNEEFRCSNEVGETEAERDRISRSLDAARRLWSAAELAVVQIEIGVLLAVEDAVAAFEKIGKPTAKVLLIDLIKAFIKKKLGL